MTLARLKRIAALERRQPTGKPWVDPFPAAMRLLAAFDAERVATKAGREFVRIPRPDVELGEAAQDAYDRAMLLYDGIAAKFAEQRRAAAEAKRAAKAERKAAQRAARAAEPVPAIEQHGQQVEPAPAPAPRLPIAPLPPVGPVIVPKPRATVW